jgi:hypothetical protein
MPNRHATTPTMGDIMQLRAALLSAVVLCAAYAPASAVEPVGAPSFNIQTNIDLKALNTGNF